MASGWQCQDSQGEPRLGKRRLSLGQKGALIALSELRQAISDGIMAFSSRACMHRLIGSFRTMGRELSIKF